MKGFWQTAIGIAVSLLLLYWALHDVAFYELWSHIRAADLRLLLLAIAIQTGAFVIRAARWKIFLRPALPNSAFRTRFATTCIGFMANNLLPARVGEFARAYALSKVEPIGAGAAFGSLVLERLFDALVLAVFLCVPILLPSRFDAPGFGDEFLGKAAFVLIVLGGVAAALLLLVRRPASASRLFRNTAGRLLPARVAGAIERTFLSFVAGLSAMRQPRLVGVALLWSFFHWGWGALAFFVGMLAFGITEPGYLGALFLQSVNAFAVAVPSSPGFFGLFEASVRVGLSPFGVAPAESVSFAFGFHVGTFLPVTLLGLYYLSRLGISWREMERSEDVVEEADDSLPAGASAPGESS